VTRRIAAAGAFAGVLGLGVRDETFRQPGLGEPKTWRWTLSPASFDSFTAGSCP